MKKLSQKRKKQNTTSKSFNKLKIYLKPRNLYKTALTAIEKFIETLSYYKYYEFIVI